MLLQEPSPVVLEGYMSSDRLSRQASYKALPSDLRDTTFASVSYSIILQTHAYTDDYTLSYTTITRTEQDTAYYTKQHSETYNTGQ